ncbi:FAD-dependent oxidoreductase [Pseudonocardia sp. RS010]|uniref:FAD-dependent oxidoreductase n=1 Tax=Pseudonocardia sp. RS010 TaxID=3385979 RepID=UPI0039A388F3
MSRGEHLVDWRPDTADPHGAGMLAERGTGTGPHLGRAVVLGAGMAGLLAARVLAEACAEVVVVERDLLPDEPAARRGVPQGRHIHALLARGQQVLEALFPGLSGELVAAGVPTGDMLGDVRTCFGGHRFARTRSGLVALSASRPMLEAHVRRRVRDLPGVEFRDGCDVVGLATGTVGSGGDRVVGARILRRADGSAEQVLAADLVVDATGRGSRVPTWLDDLGRGRPRAERVGVDIRYASRVLRLPPDALGGDLAVLTGPTPAHPRGGALAAIEGGHHLLTLFGMGDDAPPRDPDGFGAFARSLQFPDIADAVAEARPLSDPVPYRFPAAVRHSYHRVRDLPAGLLVVGDALCSFNPIYGQGVTVAALEALALRRHLAGGAGVRSAAVRRDLAGAGRAAWDLATGADLAFPAVEGRRGAATRFSGAYVARLQAAAADDPVLARAFVRVTGLVDPPPALLRPGVAARVLAQRARLPTRAGRRAG